ncbi:MAG TPA: hypothetical protein VLA28_12210, partial [Afifellaceae bacterium]|nr:hypothetical protein [Afifellaceae bacterium]
CADVTIAADRHNSGKAAARRSVVRILNAHLPVATVRVLNIILEYTKLENENKEAIGHAVAAKSVCRLYAVEQIYRSEPVARFTPGIGPPLKRRGASHVH